VSSTGGSAGDGSPHQVRVLWLSGAATPIDIDASGGAAGDRWRVGGEAGWQAVSEGRVARGWRGADGEAGCGEDGEDRRHSREEEEGDWSRGYLNTRPVAP
jgi:hypothetical protein